ncbi:Thymus-specific serine protease [Pseudolycoriella hygida]|uniref:Thymus-specific serine protease n=1 Tax=Pseudolycoriella hygida TaxID=35572 RepID=A0A9Q0S5M0_9DIPT|nr:Thymus-specific serine protease [Pseudolycoriella hygida]
MSNRLYADMIRCLVFLIAVMFTCADKIGLSKLAPMGQHEPRNFSRKSTRIPVMEFVEQRLDNFNSNNDETWLMRYYRNDEFFVSGGPIFIFVGGQWPISGGLLLGGHMFDMAEELRGQMFYTEHRFYGFSHPTSDVSMENLKYLNAEQALADLAHFIMHIRRSNPEFDQSPVILVGGAYGGNIVTWFRQKYPHLVTGAWASSAPVLGQYNFNEYYEVVGAAIRHAGGESCFQRFAGAFRQSEEFIALRRFTEFSNLFRTCEEINDENVFDVMEMFTILAAPLTRVIQYHRTGDINRVCDILLNSTDETDIEAYGRWFTGHVFGDNDDDCVDFSFDNDVLLHRNTSWDSPAVRSNDRQWFYQTCTEFGWFRTTDSQFQPFGSSITIDYFLRFCSDVFGEMYAFVDLLNRSPNFFPYKFSFTAEKIQQNIERKNVLYGGLQPDVSNVYFTHGGMDPWRPMGIQSDLNSKSPADVTPDGSHWQDLNSGGPDDSPQMRAVRERIISLVKIWTNTDGR